MRCQDRRGEGQPRAVGRKRIVHVCGDDDCAWRSGSCGAAGGELRDPRATGGERLLAGKRRCQWAREEGGGEGHVAARCGVDVTDD